jgi:CO/xanthine dehydrogenase Mo-binding subunit
MSAARTSFRFLSTKRRVREDRRFVAGRGWYVADIKAEGMLHVALVPSPHPAARITAINAGAARASQVIPSGLGAQRHRADRDLRSARRLGPVARDPRPTPKGGGTFRPAQA